MFGTNTLRKRDHGDGLHLQVQTIFSTIQGEGPFAGMPAIFLRLAGCNLRCYFCDTDFESKEHSLDISEVVREIQTLATKDPKVVATKLVVITGGEPMRQNIVPLCEELSLRGFLVQIETAGTLWVSGLHPLIERGKVHLVCSPKTGEVVQDVSATCGDWKYLIREGRGEISDLDGLPMMSTQVKGVPLRIFRPPRKEDTVWLQPCEAYKVGYQTVPLPLKLMSAEEVIEELDLADQRVTSSVRDEEQTQKNIRYAAELAMKYNYRISLQLHKLLNLP